MNQSALISLIVNYLEQHPEQIIEVVTAIMNAVHKKQSAPTTPPTVK